MIPPDINQRHFDRSPDAVAGGGTWGRGGFSLVEVTMAIGITAFALVALLGLLPVGLSTFAASSERTVLAQVAQRLVAEANQADFSKVEDGADRYFSVDGIEVPASESIFTARVLVEDEFSVPGTQSVSDNLKVVRVQMVRNPGAGLPKPFSLRRFKSFVAYVVRTD